MIGEVLGGRYALQEVLGKGGFAVVYRARQLSIDREVAVKVLKLDRAQDRDIGHRFEREARIISQLRHPNTLKLIDFGETDDGHVYLVTELLTGHPLDTVLEAGPLPPRLVLSIVQQVAGALEEAHELGIVHRDLKPANIFIERVGRRHVAKVLDFGIAKVHSDQSQTISGQMFGTPRYMSPEQVKEGPLDGRSDLYSLGVVAYHCLTGHTPFTGSNNYALLVKHTTADPPPMRDFNPHMGHADFEVLVRDLLAKRPEDRPQDASTLIDRLEALDRTLMGRGEPAPHDVRLELDANGSHSWTGARPASIPQTSTPKASALRWGLLVGLVGILVVAGLVLFGDGPPPGDTDAPPSAAHAVAEKPEEGPPADASVAPSAVVPSVPDASTAPQKKAVPKPRRRPVAIGKIQLGLSPLKAVYDVGARPKLVPRITDPQGKAVHPNRVKLEYRVTPKDVATVRGGRLRFLKAGRGKVSACYRGTCGRALFMSVEDNPLP